MQRKNLLIIEDDPKSLFAMRAVMQDAGFQVFTCSSTEELDACDHQHFDAAIVDVRLSGAPGTEAAEILQRNHPGIRIVFVTAYNGVEKIRAQFPGCAVLVKPVEMETVFRLLGAREA